jgi:hypothetical protein
MGQGQLQSVDFPVPESSDADQDKQPGFQKRDTGTETVERAALPQRPAHRKFVYQIGGDEVPGRQLCR